MADLCGVILAIPTFRRLALLETLLTHLMPRLDATWLQTLIACGDKFDAHLVGGPVIGVLPENATALARNGIFASRRRWPTGLVETLNTTQNLAISRQCVELLSPPLFNSRYGASGGEDYDLFRKTARAGASSGTTRRR